MLEIAQNMSIVVYHSDGKSNIMSRRPPGQNKKQFLNTTNTAQLLVSTDKLVEQSKQK